MGSKNERFKDISLKSHSWDFQRDFRFDHFILGTKYIIYIKQGDDDILNALTS